MREEPDCTVVVPGTLAHIRWLSPTVAEDIMIDGVPINIPAGLLREMEPEAYGLLAGTDADAILNRPLMDAEAIRDRHADSWHSRHYPAGTSVDADTFGLSGGIMDVDVHMWTLNVDAPQMGTKGADEAAITLDQTYVIRSVHDASGATLRMIGTGVFYTEDISRLTVFYTEDWVEIVADSPIVIDCEPRVELMSMGEIVFALVVFALISIIASMLIIAHRRDRRLQRNDDGQQSPVGAPP